MEIKHQTQPNGWSCVHTCIAMVTGLNAEEVIRDHGQNGLGMNLMETFEVLNKYQLHFAPLIFGLWHGWQLMSVPSLNMERGLHCVLCHWDRETGNTRILDPAIGRRYAEDGSDLLSYSDVILVSPQQR